MSNAKVFMRLNEMETLSIASFTPGWLWTLFINQVVCNTLIAATKLTKLHKWKLGGVNKLA